MINNANAYAKCKNCDRINGNYGNKGTNNDKNRVSVIATALHINSNHFRSKDMRTIIPTQDFVDLLRFG